MTKKSWYWGLSFLLIPHLAVAQYAETPPITELKLSPKLTTEVKATNPLKISPDLIEVKANDLVDFTASGGSGKYNWQVVRGSLSSTQGDTVIYTAPRCAGGCQDFVTVSDSSSDKSQTAEITIAEPPLCRITPEHKILLPGGEEEFIVTNVEGPVNWTADSGNIIERGTEATYTAPATVGTYSLTATEINAPYCEARAFINVVKNCHITPQKATLILGETKEFKMVGPDCEGFNWTTTSGDIKETHTDTAIYTPLNIPGSYEVIIVDTVGNRKTAPVEVISSLSVHPQEISLKPGEYRYITVVTGQKPYRAIPIRGDISQESSSSDVFKFTAGSEIGEDAIEICDDTEQCKTVSVYVERVLSLTGLPKLVQVNEEYQITVTGGKGDYISDADYGQIKIDQRSGDGTYTTPDTDGIDKITINDGAGNTLERTIEVKGYVLPYILPSSGVGLKIGETKIFSVNGGIPPFLWDFNGSLVDEISERRIKITAPNKRGIYQLSVIDAKNNASQPVTIDVELSLRLTPTSYNVYKGEAPKVRFEKLGGADDSRCEWILDDLEESEISDRRDDYVIVQPRVKDVELGKEYQVICRDDTNGEEASAIITVSKLKFDSDSDGRINTKEVSIVLELFFTDDGEMDKTMLFFHLESFMTTQ
jgi:hypothetical protein